MAEQRRGVHHQCEVEGLAPCTWSDPHLTFTAYKKSGESDNITTNSCSVLEYKLIVVQPECSWLRCEAENSIGRYKQSTVKVKYQQCSVRFPDMVTGHEHGLWGFLFYIDARQNHPKPVRNYSKTREASEGSFVVLWNFFEPFYNAQSC